MSADTLIIGIGNRLRGDDALGCLAAERLAGTAGAEVIEHDGESASLMDKWNGFARVVLIDAVSSGAAPGTVFEIDLRERQLNGLSGAASTHAFGVAEAVELARALDKLPPRIVFYGIEADSFATGTGPSPRIDAALADIQQRIKEAIHA